MTAAPQSALHIWGARGVGHRLRRDMAPVTPEAMTYKTNSASNVTYTRRPKS